jgi:CRISPR-associated protein Cas2
MLEVAPGIYTSPKLGKSVRERIWSVCSEWFEELEGTAIVMVWQDPGEPGGQGLRFLGVPPKELCEYQGVILTRRSIPAEEGDGC